MRGQPLWQRVPTPEPEVPLTKMDPTFYGIQFSNHIHRILATNMLARGDSGGVRIDEVHMIWGMMSSTNVNFGAFFMMQLESQSRLNGSNISIGGLLTLFALAIDINLGDM